MSEWYAEAHKRQASGHLPTAAAPDMPNITTPAHHNKLIPAKLAPRQEAHALAEDPAAAYVAGGESSAPATMNDPLRQKSSLLAGNAVAGDAVAGDEDAVTAGRDVIPSLPRVSYSTGGEWAGPGTTAQTEWPSQCRCSLRILWTDKTTLSCFCSSHMSFCA